MYNYHRSSALNLLSINNGTTSSFRVGNELYTRNLKTVRYGTKTRSSFSQEIQVLVPQKEKDSSSLTSFEKRIAKQKPTTHAVYSKYFCNMWFI